MGNPISASMVLRDVRETGGGFVAVSDEALREAMGTVASTSGVIPEPAAAAAYAGLDPAITAGLVDRNEKIVVLITGTGLKTPKFLRPLRSAFTVRAELREVQEVLQGGAELAAQR